VEPREVDIEKKKKKKSKEVGEPFVFMSVAFSTLELIETRLKGYSGRGYIHFQISEKFSKKKKKRSYPGSNRDCWYQKPE
jgi:hypothetical protein